MQVLLNKHKTAVIYAIAALLSLLVLAIPAPAHAIARVDENGNVVESSDTAVSDDSAMMRTTSMPADDASVTTTSVDDSAMMQTTAMPAGEPDVMMQSGVAEPLAAEATDLNAEPVKKNTALPYLAAGAVALTLLLAGGILALRRTHRAKA